MPSHGKIPRDDIIQFKNCRLLRDHKLIIDDLWVRNGKILNPEKLFFDEKTYADVQIDCQGCIIAPGYIDVQINGGFGHDFSTSTENVLDGLEMVAKGLLPHGVTSFCPTIVTSPPEIYRQILPRMKRFNGGPHGAGNLGVHIEGPFISKEKKGAHPENFILDYENGWKDVMAMYHDLTNVAIVTVAPEKDCTDEVINEFIKRDIVVSVGHSMANLKAGEKAVQEGATFITHLFNAMLPFHHRDPHLVGLLTSDKIPEGKTVFFGIISDGIHTHPAALRIAHRVHPLGLVLITDAIPALGLEKGTHRIGQQVMEIKNNKAVIAGTDILCGSIGSMNECVQHFFESTECTQIEALECATLHPAQLLKITDSKGTLDYNTDADFILLNDKLDVLANYIDGQLVWEGDKAPKRRVTHIKK
ncbi:unnamed protein product [Owenia fusiformis]|uniref:N-acetylglucosamine-6-phosphate deacetylase n=1 Tax=Owenia fusiformis TaxID=6347 RepID=A0A8J1TID4_OWEFU|nr:unnamed protein product [Owenia fusiformis]